MVLLALQAHVEMAHLGYYKLYELMVTACWHPSLRKVVKDACFTCSICQKGKSNSGVILPPTLKIQTHAPFEFNGCRFSVITPYIVIR